MMRKISILTILLFSFSALKAQDTVAVAPVASVVVDEVAAIVGNSAILMSDIEKMAARVVEMRKAQGTMSTKTEKEEAFEMLLTQNLLTTRARIDSLEKELSSVDDIVDQKLEKLRIEAGGVAELERKMGKPIYQIRADIALDAKQERLAQAMEQKIRRSTTINHGEVREFIKTIPLDSMDLIPRQYVYSQIIKGPEQTDERRYAIRERLLEYRKRILAGETTIGALAQLYSADPGSARRRGEMGPQHINTFVEPFTEAVRALKPGEVSEIVETEHGYHLIELISFQDGQDPEVYPQVVVRHILLKPEFTVEESRQVENELDSIAKEIRAGRLTFEAAALKYSTDAETRENGGRAYNKAGYFQTGGDIRAASSRFMPDELMPADYMQLSRLKPGEISDPYDKTYDDKGNSVYKIVRLDKIIEAHVANIDDDFDVLQTIALRVKESKVIQEWIDDMIEKTYIEIKPEYMDYDFDRQGWKNAALRSAKGKNVKITERPRPMPQAATTTQNNTK